jgi:undecaprenyl-diphosphatase
MLDKLIALDTNLFLWLNGHNSPFWDKVMWFISGRNEWIPVYVLFAAYIIYRYRWQSIPVIIAIIVAVTLADQLAVHLFKDVFQRPRPTYNPAIQNLVHVVNDYRGGTFGFISNHAADTFVFATFLSFLFKNRYFTISILSWAAIVSYSRIYLGVHYPGDVLGGMIFGSFLGWLIFTVYFQVDKKIKLYKNSSQSLNSEN